MAETLLVQALLTLEEAKVYLKRTTTTDDEVITRLINYATGQIEQFTDRQLKLRTYTGGGAIRFSGRGVNEVAFPQFPISTVDMIEVLDGTGAVIRELNITGWRASARGMLYLPNDGFERGYLNHVYTGAAGISTSSAEWKALTGICLRWVQVMFQDWHNGIGRGVAMTVGGNSVSLIDAPMPKDIRSALLPFARLM